MSGHPLKTNDVTVLQFRDKLGADDYIGTCFLNLSEISASGEDGYLPTFGPCFINVYGSPREFSDLPDKYDHLNKGLVRPSRPYWCAYH